MRTLLLAALLAAFAPCAFADTPPPGTVKAKVWSGDGVTSITATGSALNTQVIGSALPANACKETGGNLASILTELQGTLTVAPLGGSMTVDQGRPGPTASPWPVAIQGSSTITGVVSQGTPGPTASPWPVAQQGTVTVAGTVTANAGTGTFTVDGSGHTQPVSGTFWQATQPVSGTFWQATQPISAAALPLPSGAATSAKQPALGTAGSPSTDVLTVQGRASMTPLLVDGSGATQPVSGTVTANAGTGTFTVDGSGHTQPISASSLPLPTGASTSAKQPALGTAGTPSSDVISVQGKSGMTALVVDGSGVTQPVSGTFWQATQPVSGTVTANAGSGTFTVDGSGHTQPVSGTFWQATQPVSGTITANIGTSGSLALDASVTGLQVAQNSTTSGQSGGLTQGAVTTGAPTYTTGKTDPLSLTTAGALRTDASATTQPVSGTFWQATQPVSIATAPVLVAGSAIIGKVGIDQTTPGTTNGVQVNAALPAGSAVIGKVSIDQTTPGTTNLVALAANQSVNVAQINAVTPLMGNGVTGTGSQRVTVASDNTAFSVNAAARTPTAVTVKQAAVTIGTSAVRLTNDGSAPAATRVLLVAQLLSTSTATCYLGSSGVTTTSTTRGVVMAAGQVFAFNNDAGDYYAICDASSQTFLITEQE